MSKNLPTHHSLTEFGVTFEHGKLANGTDLFLFRRAGMPLAFQVIFYAGSRFDAVPGTAHFLEHMILAGSKKYPTKDKLAEPMERIGGSMGASTSYNWLKIKFFLPHRDDLSVAIDSLEQVLLNSLFTDETIERERGSIQDELRRDLATPGGRLNKISDELFYHGTPYERDVGGDAQSVAAITKKDMLEFKEQFLRSGRMRVVASGDISFSDLEKSLNTVVGKLPPEPAMDTSLPLLPIIRERFIASEPFNDNSQAYLRVGFRTVSLNHPDRAAMNVVGDILGSGRTSRLMIALRYKKGLVYGIGAGNSSGPDEGLFGISTSCQPTKLQETLDTVIDEIARLRKGELTENEMDFARTSMVKACYGNMQTSQSWMGDSEEFIFNREAPRTVVDYMNAVEQVTREQVIAAAQKYLGPENIFVAAVGTPTVPTVKKY